jgi:Ner family transcriptional regulator
MIDFSFHLSSINRLIFQRHAEFRSYNPYFRSLEAILRLQSSEKSLLIQSITSRRTLKNDRPDRRGKAIMAHPRADWHREDIKAAIRRSGITLAALSSEHGFTVSSCSWCLMRPWPRMQAIIAQRLGVAPQTIWPSRYDAAGAPLPSSEIIARRVDASSQKRKAA